MLKGKTVFITGGTGYLGRGICRRAAEYGAKIIFTYNRNAEKAEALVSELPGAKAMQMNLNNVQEITAKIEALYKEEPVIDILVNNAAISQIMPFAMLEEEDVDLVLNINIKGTIFVTKAVVRGMIRNRHGAIVNIGSIAGQRILDVPLTYAMTKAAIPGMTHALAAELKRFDIRVNTVQPGMMEAGVAKGIPDDLREDFVRHNTRGRAGTDEDVAELVCFLASDRSSYINGQNITVDGGI